MSTTKNQISRRVFVKGLAVASVLASTRINLNAKEVQKEFEKGDILSGKVFNLSIGYSAVDITGTPTIATTINGKLHAPTLIWKEGDDITINVTNNLREDSSIHWHGIIIPTDMDGVPGISFEGIKPGETFTYKFTVKQSGTYWYHSHSGFQEQTGVHGSIIIEPKVKDPYDYDVDYVVALSDWSDENPKSIYRKLKVAGNYYNIKQRTIGDFIDEIKKDGFINAFNKRKMWNEMDMGDRDLSDVTGYTYTYLMNGDNPATNWKALFKRGQKVRLRFINSSAMTFFDVRIPGLKMRVVAADGNNIHPVDIEEFRIGVAETYDVIVEPLENKAYAIFAQSLDRTGYAIGSLTYDENIAASIPKMDPLPILSMTDMGMDMSKMNMGGMKMDNMAVKNDKKPMDMNKKTPMANMKMDNMPTENKKKSMNMDMNKKSFMTNMSSSSMDKTIPITPLEHADGPQSTMKAANPQYRLDDPGVGLRNNGREVLRYSNLKSLRSTMHDKQPDREIILHLTGNMERYMWSINGIAYPDAKPLKFHYGERLRITYINDTMMNHPMHLHGMWQDVESGANQFVRKHTVIVQPGSKISVQVTVDAMGSWAYHCHLLYHMAGMFRKVVVA
ncbi:copper resistance system multicopper oxidase [Sulfurospirillum sp. 1612]|uniref:copper resistance system multicopper oxidase n=1 Tax=Sulfurospirillum sp. 1612 TaxID=3094835 RepID=UPI002F932F8F